MKRTCIFPGIFLLIFMSGSFYGVMSGQSPVNRGTLFADAHEIINETTYCGLVTMDSLGQPHIRTMNPFPVKNDFIVWFATARASRKAKEIKSNPKVCVYFADHLSAKGYVTITGTASVIDDRDLVLKMKRDYWSGIQNWQEIFVLIKIVPDTIEVINYKHGLNNDPGTFKAPCVTLL